MIPITLEAFGAALAALTALSTAAFGLLDSTKAFGGGVSRIGLGVIRKALTPFEPALAAALGAGGWWKAVRANWINGVPKAQQKAQVGALLKLGLSPATAPSLAIGSRVDAVALTAAAAKLETGKELNEVDLNVLGRMSAALEAVLDAAFEEAEQHYRNACRAWAGAIAILLSLGAWLFWPDTATRPDVLTAITVGLLAIPMAPVAKDITSGLSMAMRALKAAKAV